MLQKEFFANVVNILEAVNLCRRCILRYFGNKSYKDYTSKLNVEKAIQKLVYPEQSVETSESVSEEENCPSSKKFLPSPCAVCLGILQESCDEMCLKVQEAVEKSQHAFKDFVLQVSLPVVADLRDKLIYYYLKEKLSDTYEFEETDIPSVKDVFKWVVGSQLGQVTNADFTPDSSFQILISSTYPDTVKECFPLYEKVPDVFPNAKKKKCSSEDVYTRSSVERAMAILLSDIKSVCVFPPNTPEKQCLFNEVVCNHSPLYFGGRYNKYSRELSQTPWVLDGERKMESSVNELITDVVQKYVICDKIVFSASGREDVDVRMLGNGRPFVLEIFNPRQIDYSKEEIKAIQNEINLGTKLIAVQNLQIISKQDISLLKEGEELKRKLYSAHCIVSKELTDSDIDVLDKIKDLPLMQKTPLRVLHRRTLSTREKILHSAQAKIIDTHHLQLIVETQAGTYVKEFVHGDFGRTNPNLGTLLGTSADILELDVMEIDLDWPPNTS